MRAVILSAGQGSRLLPFTTDLPKCLVRVGGRSLLDWQLDALAASGVEEVTVVVGFQHRKVEAALARRADPRLTTVFNPFHKVADNLASVWMARDALAGGGLLLNGDTLVSPATIISLIASAMAPVTVTVSRKTAYDADDMKVSLDGGRLTAIGKSLPAERTDAESIGLLAFSESGARRFLREVESVLDEPEGTSRWYLSAVDRIAPEGCVAVMPTEAEWCEVDRPEDLAAARALTRSWAARAERPGWTARSPGADRSHGASAQG